MSFGLLAISLLIFPAVEYAAINDVGYEEIGTEEEDVFLLRGDLETIKTFDMTRLSVANPEFADTVTINPDHIVVLAKKQGQTPLFIWDKYGKRTVRVHVFDENLELVKAHIEYLLAKVDIKGLFLEVNKIEGKLVVSGEVPSDKRVQLDGILGEFGSNIRNFVRNKSETDMVQIDAQIAELNTNDIKNLGVDWTGAKALSFAETNPGIKIDKPWDAFKIGEFTRTNSLTNVINAFIQEGKGRILSRPKIVVQSGQQANFSVGGQIPVSTRTIQNSSIVENIVYQSYGISLNVTPTIVEDDRVDINLSITVSDIDASTPVSGQVAFTNRTAQTKLYLKEKQTIVLAGLIKKDQGESVARIPFLSDIPVFGAVFRNKNSSPNKETELVISLTPTILAASKAKAPSSQGISGAMAGGQPPAVSRDYRAGTMDFSSPASQAQAFAGNEITGTKVFMPEEMVSYVQSIQQAVAQNVAYPEEARQNGWQGTVKLALHILSDGTLADVFVKESSGYELFDNNALLAAKGIAPYSAFPATSNLQELMVTIPLVYSLDMY